MEIMDGYIRVSRVGGRRRPREPPTALTTDDLSVAPDRATTVTRDGYPARRSRVQGVAA